MKTKITRDGISVGERSWWLTRLAEQKLGKGATVRCGDGEWVAERIADGHRSRITGGSIDTLEWFLKQLPDKLNRD